VPETYWQTLQRLAYNGGEFHWVALGFVVIAILLFLFVPAGRRRVRASVLLFLFATAGLFIETGLHYYGHIGNGAFSAIAKWVIQWLAFLAYINIAAVLLFDLLLELVHYRTPRIVRDLIVALAYIIAAITLLSKSGVDLTGIITTSAVITAVIGFSLADTLGNIMGGMALQVEKSINVGDWVRLPDLQEGEVTEISWRQTSIETRDWDTIVVPNSMLMKGQVTVMGRRSGRPRQQRRTLWFHVDYRHVPTEIIRIVETALRSEKILHVAQDPQPHVLLADVRESYNRYVVRYWLTDLAVNEPTDSVVRTHITVALQRANISFALPAQGLFITEETEAREIGKQRREIKHRTDALQLVELFEPLTDDELAALASQLRVAPFLPGEAMVRQGEAADSLYLITKGRAEVRVATDGNQLSEKVAELAAGDFFGEMGLMTGEPRAATVSALSEVECYCLNKAAVTLIMTDRPEIAEDMSRILARRRVELDAVREDLNELAKQQRMHHAASDLLARIRKFFVLEGKN
jgi:small-conductance mechanosensitive channel/CRP-like cAMP-binding protein